MKQTQENQLAQVEYMGLEGISLSCKNAVMRLVQFGDHIELARILSCGRRHCLLLTVNSIDVVAIRSGFASGYPGEGPRTLSFVLALLVSHGVEIEEYEVDWAFLGRVDMACLTVKDLDNLRSAPRVHRWPDYVSEGDFKTERGALWQHFPPVIPLAVIDSRITDLAMRLRETPDDSLLTGYRRLEDFVRHRTGIDEHGAKLLSRAFLGDKPKLTWKGLGTSEKTGRVMLFTAAYQAFRNPRAHRELKDSQESYVTEFLLLNHLYVLESQASLTH